MSTLTELLTQIEYDYGFVPEEFGTDKSFDDFNESELVQMYKSFLTEEINECADSVILTEAQQYLEELSKYEV